MFRREFSMISLRTIPPTNFLRMTEESGKRPTLVVLLFLCIVSAETVRIWVRGYRMCRTTGTGATLFV